MSDQVQADAGGGKDAAAPPPAGAEVKSVIPAEQPKAPEASAPEEAKLELKDQASPETKQTAVDVPKEVKSETQNEGSDKATEVKSDQTAEVKENSQEVKAQTPKEVIIEETKAQDTIEVNPAEPALVKQEAPESQATEVEGQASGVAENVSTSIQGDWQQRETELLKKIEDLEKVKDARAQESLVLELKVRDEEIDLLKARVKNLETELQAALSKPSGKNHEMIENIKRQHEELLSKARGMIFDKTKMVKNQELQIEALTSQIQSLKDINQITKDLLEIRNSEVKAMEDRLQAMEARFKAEKDRYGLVLQRAQTSSNINDDLRKEYETQLKLFKELREKYDQRVQALVTENERLKALRPGAGESSTSG